MGFIWTYTQVLQKQKYSLNTQVGSHLRQLPFDLWWGAGSFVCGAGGEDSEKTCILWGDTLWALWLWKRGICRGARGQRHYGRHFRTVGELPTHLGLRLPDRRAWRATAWSHQVIWCLWESVLVWDQENRIIFWCKASFFCTWYLLGLGSLVWLIILGHSVLRPLQSVAEPGGNQHQDLDPRLRQAGGWQRFASQWESCLLCPWSNQRRKEKEGLGLNNVSSRLSFPTLSLVFSILNFHNFPIFMFWKTKKKQSEPSMAWHLQLQANWDSLCRLLRAQPRLVPRSTWANFAPTRTSRSSGGWGWVANCGQPIVLILAYHHISSKISQVKIPYIITSIYHKII